MEGGSSFSILKQRVTQRERDINTVKLDREKHTDTCRDTDIDRRTEEVKERQTQTDSGTQILQKHLLHISVNMLNRQRRRH